MTNPRLIGALCACLLSVSSIGAKAALVLRLGGQAVYDTDLAITWLADANYAHTSGYDADGIMTQDESVIWAEQLVFGGYSHWRLPLSDTCKNMNCTNSEMGHLFYNELGGSAGSPISGSISPNLDLFFNIQDNSYWSGAVTDEVGSCPTCDYAYKFMFHTGMQDIEDIPSHLFAWAVADGDVFVPIPPALYLFASGLLGLVGVVRRKVR